MSDDVEQLLDDPAVRSALAKLARTDTRQLCPKCSTRPVPESADFCPDCSDDRHRGSKNDWWHRQGDYSQHLADGLPPAHAAKRWLAHQLRRGSVRSSTVKSEASAAGISSRTLRRAREQLQEVGRLVVEHEGRNDGGHTTRWRLTTLKERVDGVQVDTINEGDGDRLADPDDGTDVNQGAAVTILTACPECGAGRPRGDGCSSCGWRPQAKARPRRRADLGRPEWRRLSRTRRELHVEQHGLVCPGWPPTNHPPHHVNGLDELALHELDGPGSTPDRCAVLCAKENGRIGRPTP